VSEISVRRLSVTPIKGTRLQTVERVLLEQNGVHFDRRFYLIDARGRMVNGKQLGALNEVVADYSDDERRLALHFTDGEVAADTVRLGDSVDTRFFSFPREARLVEGPWSEAISERVGQPLRLVEPAKGNAVDRGMGGAFSLISRASLARFAEAAQADSVDARRFRMLIEIDGVAAHEEDRWVGQKLRIGGARVAVEGHVGRCLVTSRDPETGQIDLPTLDILGEYRDQDGATAPLPFGIHGRVLEPGEVAVGDPVELEG
jgi:uncharacterized protein YcbX